MDTPNPHCFFIAGATGYTGNALIGVAAERGRRVVAHVRPGSSRQATVAARCEAVGGRVAETPWEEDAMAEALAEHAPTAIFALLGTTKKAARAAAVRGVDAGYEAVDYGLTALLLRAARRAAPQARFVYLSSMGIGSRRPSNAYLEVRWRFERELASSGQPYTIARPSFITGPDRDESRPGERVGAVISDGALGLVGLFGGRQTRDKYRSMSATELAAALDRAAVDPNAATQILEAHQLR